jgi:hypothetical protein
VVARRARAAYSNFGIGDELVAREEARSLTVNVATSDLARHARDSNKLPTPREVWLAPEAAVPSLGPNPIRHRDGSKPQSTRRKVAAAGSALDVLNVLQLDCPTGSSSSSVVGGSEFEVLEF